MSESKKESILQWLAMEELRLAGDYQERLNAVLRRGSDNRDCLALYVARVRLDDFARFAQCLSRLLDMDCAK